MKKVLSGCMAVLLAVMMVFTMSSITFADDGEAESNANKGTLTINHTVEGKKIDLYQIFSATVSGEGDSKKVAYELNSDYVEFFQSKITGASTKKGEELNALAYQYVTDQGKDAATLAKNLLAYTDSKKIKADRSPLSEKDTTKVTFLLYGYYLVVPEGATDDAEAAEGETVKSPAMLISVTDDTATINMKSNYPTVDKEIIPAQQSDSNSITINGIVNASWEESHHMGLDDDETDSGEDSIAPQNAPVSGEEKSEDFDIGDTITFELKSKVPDMSGYTSYVFNFTDTFPKGLDFTAIQSVKVGNTVLKAGTAGTNGTYTPSFDSTNRLLTIKLNDFYNSFKDRAGETITAIYTATLNKDAVTGMNPNTNKAEIEYSNDPNGTGTGKSNPSEADVYTFNFKIFKQDEKKSPLSGAKFELYHSKTENNEEVIDETRKISLVKETTADNSNLYRESPTSGTGTTTIIESAADGYAQIKGLEEGTYFLHETEAPTGYNKLIGDIKLIIQADFDETTGDLNSFSVKYTYGTEKEQTVTVTDKDDFAIIPITNKTGTELPSTGSKGAFIVTLAGILLFGGLAVSSTYSKKKKVIK